MEEEPTFCTNCSVQETSIASINRSRGNPFYNIFLLEGSGTVTVDFTDYAYQGKIVLFSTPYQHIDFKDDPSLSVRRLQFHGDFYCIEYHKKEVACNGLLFNNIYLQPFIQLSDQDFQELHHLSSRLSEELSFTDTFSDAVARAYLQLILAVSSKIKTGSLQSADFESGRHPISRFKPLLETHFREERQPSFYADQLGISTNALSKKCREYFHRSPSELIVERVILEAKKLVHLTYHSMKEIAAELNFADENYFSRYFKKHTGVSPTTFRETVGISVVADLSR